MTQSIAATIGIDISKDYLDVAVHPETTPQRFSNDKSGHRDLVRWARTIKPENIIFEATGSYHRALELCLDKAGLRFSKMNPRQTRRFAEASGRLAKTDRIDAQMLAHFGAVLRPKPSTLPSTGVRKLTELVMARKALVKERNAAANRAKARTILMLRNHDEKMMALIDEHLKDIDQLALECVQADSELKVRFDILVSIPGIGAVSAIAMIALMPELGNIEPRQAASLAGLAPVCRQSGTWKGKSFIRGGRPLLRHTLYMPALVAARRNPDFKKKYDAMIAAGKPAKLVITTIMRKLLILAGTLIKNNRIWTPIRP